MDLKGKKIVFCVPGNSFSGRFLDCWSELLVFCMRKGINFFVSRQESCNIYYVRNMCLGADVRRGVKQKPFNGELDYDYIMWIDSDTIFGGEQFERLLSHDKDIVSGIYLMSNGREYAVVRDWDENYFGEKGSFRFLEPDDLKDEKGLVEVAYAGMGFMLVKRGVFESLEYPWFSQRKVVIKKSVDYTMEDVSFCLRAREKGFKVFVDPSVRVGHEKKIVL